MKVFKLSELSKTALSKAVVDYTEFLKGASENYYSAIDVIDSINNNGYLFHADGTLAHTIKFGVNIYVVTDGKFTKVC